MLILTLKKFKKLLFFFFFYKPDTEVAKKQAAESMYSYLSTRRCGYLVITAAIINNVPRDSTNARVIQSSKNNSHPMKRIIIINTFLVTRNEHVKVLSNHLPGNSHSRIT